MVEAGQPCEYITVVHRPFAQGSEDLVQNFLVAEHAAQEGLSVLAPVEETWITSA
jgi:hypothetical protein